ncbi:MAG: hypothetical protein BWY67_01433 [Bacteroidetes bacterium ADurb.Bin397]|nr:MAG: hypothetical protein BWY67_01433 [Bacteroidetes bacterium ADurb.Bin397]
MLKNVYTNEKTLPQTVSVYRIQALIFAHKKARETGQLWGKYSTIFLVDQLIHGFVNNISGKRFSDKIIHKAGVRNSTVH